MLKKILLFAIALISLFGKGTSQNYNVAVSPCFINEASNKVSDKSSNTETYKLKSQSINIEDYVTGVVAAEMPASFPPEALKAQAIAARTYAVRELESGTNLENIYQEYISKDDMKSNWGENYDKFFKAVSNAVSSTAGEIMIYDNEPVLAVFCSSSGGKTEESQNVWGSRLPYLKSVVSEGDDEAPDYISSVCISIYDFAEITGVSADDVIYCKITDRTEAGYVKNFCIGEKTFSGIQMRELLGLKSADFDIYVNGDVVTVTSKGFGHGVGMSQYGAAYMAKNGSNCYDILNHYYTGIKIAKMTR